MTDTVGSLSLAERAKEEARRVAEEAHAQAAKREAERHGRFIERAVEVVEALTGDTPQLDDPRFDPHAWSVNLHAAGLSFHYSDKWPDQRLSLLVNCAECADLIPGPIIARAELDDLGFAILKAERESYTCWPCSAAKVEEEERRAEALTQRVAVAPWATVHAGGRECVVVPEKWARVALALEQAVFEDARGIAEQMLPDRSF